MFRHDRATLAALPVGRWLGAAFSFSPRAALMSLIEFALVWSGFEDPREAALGSANMWGDHVGHTAALGRVNAARLAGVTPHHDTAEEIASGRRKRHDPGLCPLGRHARRSRGGGLPAGFAGSPIPERDPGRDPARCSPDDGARFLDLADRYPRSAFFDTPDHLNEEAQIAHSRVVAAELAAILAPARAASR